MQDSTMQYAIECRGLSKVYKEFTVLQDINFTVQNQERIVICGPSGSGKSTLIRCINGLESYQDGELVVLGKPMNDDLKNIELIRQQVGMCFQQFNLFPHLTVLENCTLAPRWVKKMSMAQASSIARELLARVKILEQADKYPHELSGGQQQRVAIARSLCMQPKIMLFDEPTSALDPEMIKEVLDVIMGLADEGMTMVCVTHEMAFAKSLADRILFLDHGELIEENTPAEFFAQPKTARAQEFLQQILRADS